MLTQGYDKRPMVRVDASLDAAVSGWPAIAEVLAAALREPISGGRPAVGCYVGVSMEEVEGGLRESLGPSSWFDTRDALLPEVEIVGLIAPDMGDPKSVLGLASELELACFFDVRESEGCGPVWTAPSALPR